MGRQSPKGTTGYGVDARTRRGDRDHAHARGVYEYVNSKTNRRALPHLLQSLSRTPSLNNRHYKGA